MESNIDSVINVLQHLDLHSLVQYIDSNKALNDCDVWKLLFLRKYPNKPFIKTWTSRQNYLVAYYSNFAIIINVSNESIVNNTLYEHGSTLDEMFSILNKYNNEECLVLLQLTVENNFVIIYQDCYQKVNVLSQCSNNIDCVNFITKHFNETYSKFDYPEDIRYIIINYETLVPKFWKQNNDKGNNCVNDFTVIRFEQIDDKWIVMI